MPEIGIGIGIRLQSRFWYRSRSDRRARLVGHGPFINAIRAGNVCSGRQARNHRAHYILRAV